MFLSVPDGREKALTKIVSLFVLSIILYIASYMLEPIIHSAFSAYLPGYKPGQIAYFSWIISSFLTGIVLLTLVYVTIKVEKPTDWRSYLNLKKIDTLSILLFVGLTTVLQLLENAYLRDAVFEPIRLALISIGFWGKPSLEFGFGPDPALKGLNLFLLMFVLWIEAPEEGFFRGYIQNRLQELVGKDWAMLLGALMWDIWHVFAPAEFFRRLFYALAVSLVFRIRQNTTALAIVHPLGNRLLMIQAILNSR